MEGKTVPSGVKFIVMICFFIAVIFLFVPIVGVSLYTTLLENYSPSMILNDMLYIYSDLLIYFLFIPLGIFTYFLGLNLYRLNNTAREIIVLFCMITIGLGVFNVYRGYKMAIIFVSLAFLTALYLMYNHEVRDAFYKEINNTAS